MATRNTRFDRSSCGIELDVLLWPAEQAIIWWINRMLAALHRVSIPHGTLTWRVDRRCGDLQWRELAAAQRNLETPAATDIRPLSNVHLFRRGQAVSVLKVSVSWRSGESPLAANQRGRQNLAS